MKFVFFVAMIIGGVFIFAKLGTLLYSFTAAIIGEDATNLLLMGLLIILLIISIFVIFKIYKRTKNQ